MGAALRVLPLPELEHQSEVLRRVLFDGDVELGEPFAMIEACVGVIAAGSDGRTEVHGWYRQDAARVLRRCHGIVRRIALRPRRNRFYVVVIARGVASLHLVRGTGAPPYDPEIRGTREGLGYRVIAPNLVAEPWSQWHARDGATMTTHWELPGGLRGSGQATLPARPAAMRDAVDRTMELNAEAIASARARTENVRGWGFRYIVVQSSEVFGDQVVPYQRGKHRDALRLVRRKTRREPVRHVKGYDTVFVMLDHGVGVRWLPRGRARDVMAPRPLEMEYIARPKEVSDR
jgi:hypothetical protein